MRTTLDIDDDLLAEAMKEAGATTKTETVRLGLQALVAAAARRRIAALHGKIPDAAAPPRRRLPASDRAR
jgi:Arc/MetJ family transcription regulator